MQNSLDVQRQLDRGILDNFDKLNKVVQQTVDRLNQHIQSFPQFTWLATLIVNKMTQSSLDLQRITEEARRCRIAVEPFARLTGLVNLRDIHSENTGFLSITRINDHTLNLKFFATIESPDTHAYEVFGFPHWDNLDEVPRLLEYTGARYLIYNSTSNCIKSMPNLPLHNADQCLELDAEDPALKQWKVVTESSNIESYPNLSTVLKTLRGNVIYCLPGSIEIDGHKYKCPYEPFELPPNRGFRTSQQRHVPSLYTANLNQTSYVISAVHAGQYLPDSDVIQHLAMFDKLRKERELNKKLLAQLEERVAIVKGSSIFWGVVCFLIESVVGTIVYCIIIYKLKHRLEKLLQRKPSDAGNLLELTRRQPDQTQRDELAEFCPFLTNVISQQSR